MFPGVSRYKRDFSKQYSTAKKALLANVKNILAELKRRHS